MLDVSRKRYNIIATPYLVTFEYMLSLWLRFYIIQQFYILQNSLLEPFSASICPNNEEWNTCANSGCYSARNCSELGNPMICVDPSECESRCLCVDGYLRNDTSGVCVPVNECPNGWLLNAYHL